MKSCLTCYRGKYKCRLCNNVCCLLVCEGSISYCGRKAVFWFMKEKSVIQRRGGFFLACNNFLKNVGPFIPCLPLFFFFLVEISSHTLIPLFMPGSVKLAQQAEMTVAECSPTVCMWAHFQIGSHTMPWQWNSQPAPTLLGQECMRVCPCGNTGMERTLNKSQHTELTLERKILLLLLPGFELATRRSWIRRS